MSKFSHYFALESEIKKQSRGTVERTELISDFTDGKKEHLSDLSPTEYKEFLNWIKMAFKLNSNAPSKRKADDWQNTRENRMRRKIIALFKQMSYTLPNGNADMEAINAWCIHYGKIKKPLNDYTKDELVIIISQVEIILKKFTQSVTK